MTNRERFDDPALAKRLGEWIQDASPAAAPERLVFAVMDEVDRQPRGGLRFGGLRFAAVWQYVALTVVIAIGVAAGTLLTRQNAAGPVGSPRPSASPAARPSLPALGRYAITRAPGPSAIAAIGDSLFVGTPDGTLIELDPASGTERSRTTIGVEPITIREINGALWIGSGAEDLVWVDLATHEVRRISGAGGPYVLLGAGAIWVSRHEAFLRIDPATRGVVGSIPVPGHMDSDPGVVQGDELIAATGSGVVRVALPSGTMVGRTSALVSALVTAAGRVFGVSAGALVEIDGTGAPGPPRALVEGLPESAGASVAGDRLWLTGQVAGRETVLVEIDLATMAIASRTIINGGARAIAVAGSSVWIGVVNGTLLRFGT